MIISHRQLLCFCGTCLLIFTITINGPCFSNSFHTSVQFHIGAYNSHRMARQVNYNLSMQVIATDRSIIYSANATYKWLFLSSWRTYHQMMHRHYFSLYYAAKRHPHIVAHIWGLGFPGFNESLPIVENIRRRFGSFDYFDVLFQSGGKYEMIDYRLASRYSPIMSHEHECWGYRCLPDVIDPNVTILLQTYAYEMDLYHKSFSYNRVIAHVPLTAEPLVFYPPIVLRNDTPPHRDIDLLVVGALSDFVYPLRTRISNMVKKGSINNSYLQVHPSYSLNNSTIEQTEKYMHEYAAVLRRAKVVVVDSSRYGYALNKYTEVALSGCLIIGDIPAEREEEFRQFIVEISMNMTDAEILTIIDYWIKHDDERQKKAALGQQIVLTKYTWDHSIDLALQALIKYRQGRYGIYHNYPYSTQCFPVDNVIIKQAATTNWCLFGLRGLPHRSLCECNRTKMNYMHEELDLDKWNQLGINVNASNLGLFRLPRSLLQRCESYDIIRNYIHGEPYQSLCLCQETDGSWQNPRICRVSNTALSISRYLAHLDVR